MIEDLSLSTEEYVDAEVVEKVAGTEDLIVQAAREDPVTFVSYVLRDEEHGGPIMLRPMHKRWQRDITERDRVVIFSHVESGKTQSVSIGRTLFEIGKNPNTRALIVSNTSSQSEKIGMSIGRYIEQSAEFRKVFPHVRPDKNISWTKHAMAVTGRKGQPKEANITSIGVHGNILGARIDWLVLDDILDYENALSAYQREDLYRWVAAILLGRLSRKAKIICVGTAWHIDDIMHRYARAQDIWYARRYPIINSRGELTWPERWPLDRIEAKRKELGPIEYSRQLECTARSDAAAKFKSAWIEKCKDRGRGVSLAQKLKYVPAGYQVYTGVDLSTGKTHTRKSDMCVLFTIAIHPDGSKQPLSVEFGKWSGPEIVRRVLDAHTAFKSKLIVENNASQDFIVQFLAEHYKDEGISLSEMPVWALTTGSNKRDPRYGVESLAVEMERGEWVIPCDAETGELKSQGLKLWVQDMFQYDPKAHTGDFLMASWFVCEAARGSNAVVKASYVDYDFSVR